MKRIFKCVVMLTVATMFTAYQAKAQLGIGGGYVTSNLTEEASGLKATYSLDGFYVELDYKLLLNDNVAIIPSAKYINVKGPFPGSSGQSDWNEQYVDIPIKVAYNIVEGNGISLGVYIAPTLSYCLSSQWSANGTSLDFFNLMYEVTGYNGAYKREDILLALGLNAEINSKVILEIGYSMGLGNRYSVQNQSIKRKGVNIGIAYCW